ncbi:MAG: hypothetical protein N4A50_05180 [Vallitalea sp.]|jgi:hypothetical protein|nr:hypothetical protein [Vallitalea sp.]
MKKILLILIAILMLTSCNNDHNDKLNNDKSISNQKDNNDSLLTEADTTHRNIADNPTINDKPIDKSIQENITLNIEILRQNQFYENKLYSPNKENYILVSSEDYREEEYLFYDVFSNDRKNRLGSIDELNPNTIKWLNNNLILINGEFIYDIQKTIQKK